MHLPETEYNLASLLLRRCDLNPERTAVLYESGSTSYGELGEQVRRLAGLFRANGVCAGDRVAYLGLNHPLLLHTMFAAQALGAIFVPLNFRLTAQELTFIINDSGAHTLVVDDALRPVIEPVRTYLCCRAYFASESAVPTWIHLPSERDAADPFPEAVVRERNDVAVIMYTSGTTGLPKGAMLTHGNLLWNNINSMFAFGTKRDDVVLTAAPLFHIGGLNVLTLTTLHMGAKLILHRQFDPVHVLADIERYRVTNMFGAPAMFLFMSQQPEFATTDLSSIDFFVVGAAPVPLSLLELYAGRGIDFCQGYGLTETAPFASFLSAEWAKSKAGSAGQAPLLSEVRIVDDDNQPVAAGERGEVCARGPNIMKGYWNRPDATAATIDEQGWLHSGDIGYLDADGFLFICDRLKDMVISGGENVYPAEVESVLYEHEAIAEVAVVGLSDEKWGEAVTAVVALHSGHELSLAALRDFAEPKLARYKLPLRLHLVDELPRNPAGKVLKFVLREQFEGQG